ncbi:MAG: hypothetical protein U9O94_04155 [Nanoarchaeota archaeon]|nr:hypothetical protein [Nanoarchaeota archaeon]
MKKILILLLFCVVLICNAEYPLPSAESKRADLPEDLFGDHYLWVDTLRATKKDEITLIDMPVTSDLVICPNDDYTFKIDGYKIVSIPYYSDGDSGWISPSKIIVYADTIIVKNPDAVIIWEEK